LRSLLNRSRLRCQTPQPTFAAAAKHWQRFWNEGVAIELSESTDPRAEELERRIVLSQYLTTIQCLVQCRHRKPVSRAIAGTVSFISRCIGGTAAHFALWNRLPLLEKSLDWYSRILPGARTWLRPRLSQARRWPKMVGPEGRDSPSPVGPLLIWQQPHPIFYAELCFRSHPNRATLTRYRDIVFDSAEFMASYAYFESMKQRYVLGPPVIPAQEKKNHPARETWNPYL
jgi:hypothetical protein